MFKILCEQYKLDAVQPESAGVGDAAVMVLQVACLSGLPIGTPQGPQIIPIPTVVVQIVMDEKERAEVRMLLDAYDAAQQLAGEPRPEGASDRRCGRLQEHPSHAYETQDSPGGHLWWCDGGSVLTDIGATSEATDELPAAT